MLVVAALGVNEPLTAQNQRANVATAAASLARIIKAGHRLVVTHGNGPQIGLLALQGAAYKPDEVFPLDVLGAETDGMIGYMIEQALENALGHDRPVATLLTQIEVDPKDPAFARPTKFIGPVYDKAEAERLAEARGWSIAADGQHWRRVVASPMPSDIPDLKVLELLLEQDVTLICAGGGGIPVVRRADGSLIGIEAVIDKDHATALLAHKLKADALLLLTDVEAVFRGFGTEAQSAIRRVSPEAAVRLDLPEGSMAPKVAAAASFVSGRDRYACVGRLEDALAMLEGRAGTMIAEAD